LLWKLLLILDFISGTHGWFGMPGRANKNDFNILDRSPFFRDLTG
jgi:hypothetical protein